MMMQQRYHISPRLVLHYWMGGRVPRGLPPPLPIVRRRSYSSSGSAESSLIVCVCVHQKDSRGKGKGAKRRMIEYGYFC